ncbi:DNA methyltransferase, partial [Salmonella enterica subsp. enterica serovar Virginia]|nr:DNA methyltransferase [Salmonella enterica subsp. enterica serovar Virginia]
CPVGGVVLDPFFGAGTTGVVALKLDRSYVGIELNPDYIELAKNRIKKEQSVLLKSRKNANHSFQLLL